MAGNAIQVSIALPARLTPERIAQLVTMATSSLYWQLCCRYREQKRETRQRSTNIRAGFDVDARWADGDFDREAIRRYLTADPTASAFEVQVALGVRDAATVAAVRAELSDVPG